MQIKGPGGGGPVKGPDEPKDPAKATEQPKAPADQVGEQIERIPKSAFTESLRGVGGLGQPGGPGGPASSHVNSGPTGHSNGAGHANFTRDPDFQKFENSLRGLLSPQGDFAARPAFKEFAAKMGSLLDRVGSQRKGDGGTAHANNIPPDQLGKAGRATMPAGQLAVGGLGGAASHVNSGPTGHSNGAGHANFSREAIFDKFVNEARTLLDKAASHVNSGPTGHSNGAGHANFADRGLMDKVANPATNVLNKAASHVNSGPTGHSNGAGHANFADNDRFKQYVNEFENVINQARTGFLGHAAASHVNSGPTGHSNGAGHANFADRGNPGDKIGNPGNFNPGGGFNPG
jgi:hypothetical protein